MKHFSLKRLLHTDWRLLAFGGAILVYGLFGTPTPDRLGFPEIATGLFLIAAAGGWQVGGLFRRFWVLPRHALWLKASLALLLYGMSVPLLAGVMAGHEPELILRDMIPFIFLLLPLFLHPGLAGAFMPYTRPLTVCFAIAGFGFAARSLALPLCQQNIVPGACAFAGEPDTYLANAPMVLAAALLCLGLAGKRLYDGAAIRNVAESALLFGVALVPFASMALAMQRASFALAACAVGALLVIGLIRRPFRMVLPGAALGLILWLGWNMVSVAMAALAEKTALVGFNMRWAEARAVIDEVAPSLPAVLWGRGWGASFSSPAVGGLDVGYTHSLFTTYFLKTGLCGMVIAGLYLAAIAARLWRVLWRYPVVGFALGAPFVIDVFLYASFKGLGFGLLLCLILLWAEWSDRLQSGARYSTN